MSHKLIKISIVDFSPRLKPGDLRYILVKDHFFNQKKKIVSIDGPVIEVHSQDNKIQEFVVETEGGFFGF
ncbi:hypothetical protein [Desulforamulus reducens]|uniref:hypothetical protein n=1 Tax=Desulforamulus reducens TaxID=59610 RepID=UPI00030C1A85|nr:hypothetical protein [Desulforamulus reducens]